MNKNKLSNKKELMEKFCLSDSTKLRIDQEIEKLRYLKEGIYKKVKEIEMGTIINVIIDTRIIRIDKKEIKDNILKNEEPKCDKEREPNQVDLNLSSQIIKEKEDKDKNEDNVENCLPDFINFVIVLDCTFPTKPPKLLMKTNITFPSLVDGRNLINEITPNWDSENISLLDIIHKLPDFLIKIMNRKVLHNYGSFEIGSIYNTKNFYSMSVNIFNCSVEKEIENDKKSNKHNIKTNNKKQANVLNSDKIFMEVTMVLSDNSLLILEPLDNEKTLSKLIFWSLLFSIRVIEINVKERKMIIRFFDDSKNIDAELRLKIDNIILFKEAMTMRMNKLKIRGENQKQINGKNFEKILTDKDINNMTIDELINNFKHFDIVLKKRLFSFYNINSFFNITKKIVEYYSARNDQNHQFYLGEMKNLLKNEEIKRIFVNY